MRKVILMILAAVLLAGFCVPALAASKTELDAAVNDAARYMLAAVKNPQVAPVGGEWAILGLARSGYNVPDAYYENYYRTVENFVKACNGVLHEVKYTEYSRVVLGLTAAGYDPRDVAGYDLTEPLDDYDKTIWQGINGPLYALIALDSMNYPNSQRDKYIAEILRRQLNDGGWNLSGGTSESTKNQAADADLTGTALQALAKYQDKPEVKAAIDRALDCLSKTQDSAGGYRGSLSGNTSDLESAVQVLVALCELGISWDDARYVKNGKTIIDNILSYKNADGSFNHTRNSGVNQMATEQALYGLAAAQRALDGKNSLYNMSDAVKRGESKPMDTAGLPGKHTDVNAVPITVPGKTFPDIQSHANQTAIESLAARGIITGMDDFSFAPDATMTRAQFAAITTRGLGLPEKTTHPFNDVSATAWYFKPIATAYFYEIIKGASAATFNPEGKITRQEAAVMVARAAKLCGMDTERSDVEIRNTLAQFGDYRTVADWAQSEMAFCYSSGILDDSAFNIEPAKVILRCEIAEMLYRMLGRSNLL